MSERLLQDQQADASAATLGDGPAATGDLAGGIGQATETFIPTGVPLLDRLLTSADRLSGGRAAQLQRVVSYLICGGFAAVVNLVALYLLTSVIQLPVAEFARYWVAQVIATELSIMANFIPNDRFTFSRLPGHARSWWVRCARFHSTTIAGALVTVGVSSGLHYLAHLQTLVAQFIAIWIALIFNYTFHHLWTYRHLATSD